MTTNYENSKKLAEIGFVGESETRKHDPENFMTGQKYWSYDLETLIESLPAFIEYEDRTYHFWLWNEGMGYYPNYDKYSGEAAYDMDNGIFEFAEDESLADTTARLLIQLFEAGIVNFNK